MKSLNNNTEQGCPFNNRFFTEEVVMHILKEGFNWRDKNDSYTEYKADLDVHGCYKKYEDGGGVDIFIYICEDGIEIDKDLDCGGNMSTNFIPYDEAFEEGSEAFEEAYDKMVNYVNEIKG